MKALYGYLVAAFLGAVIGVLGMNWFQAPSQAQIKSTSPALIRNSVAQHRVTDSASHDLGIRWIANAPVDTLGPILRALARRRPLIIRDTAWLPLDTAHAAGDTGSPEPCEVSVSCQEARRLIARDISWPLLIDSVSGDLAICRAESDSIKSLPPPRSPWSAAGVGLGVGFATGYAAGITTCILLKQ